MAVSVVPVVTLDTRDGDQVVAQSIGSLPSELSDRSDSNPAVVVIEACGNQFDKFLYALGQWPTAVITKVANLAGVTLKSATPGIVTQTFTLSSPQPADTVIPAGTQVSTSDGSLVFSTTADLTIPAYNTSSVPTPTGTVSVNVGSTAVTGSGTNFVTGSTWVGYQIQIGPGGPWYTIASVSSATALTLTTSVTATVSSVAWNCGPVSGSVQAQATTTGASTNAAASKLTTLVSSPASVATTTNAAVASGGADADTTTNAVARVPSAFAARDVACSPADFETFATAVLGRNSRAKARSGYNGSTAAAGYVTVAMLSPNWTTTTPVTTQERASVIRDLSGRIISGTTVVDAAVSVQQFTAAGSLPVIAVWKKSQYDSTALRCAIAAAINSYLSPNSYPWDPQAYSNGYRPIYAADLVGIAEAVPGVDRVEHVTYTAGSVGSTVPAVGMTYTTAANSMTFTAGSASVSCSGADSATMINGKTILYDATGVKCYLVTAGATTTTLTLHTAWAGTSGAVSAVPFWQSQDTNLTGWNYLPYAALSTSTTSPPASIIVVGSV